MRVTMVLFLFAFATTSAMLAVLLLLLLVIIRRLLLVSPLLIRKVRVTALSFNSGQLVGVMQLAFAMSRVSIVLRQNCVAGIGKLEVVQVISRSDNGDNKVPFWGQGSKKNHGLYLIRYNHLSGGEALKRCTHFVDLRARMTVGIDAKAKGFFEVLVDVGVP